MHGGVASSDGWVALGETEYEKTFDIERNITYLNLMWTTDTVSNGTVSIYLNDDPSPIFLEFGEAYGCSLGTCFRFEIKDLPINRFKVAFSEDNTNRNINYYGYY